MRQFREAFVEILLRKNYTQAEQFEARLFGRSNTEAAVGAARGGEEAQNDDNEGNGIESSSSNIKTFSQSSRFRPLVKGNEDSGNEILYH